MILIIKRIESDQFILRFEGSFSPKYHVLLEQMGEEGHPLRALFSEFLKARRPDFEVTTRTFGRYSFSVHFSKSTFGEAAWTMKMFLEQFVAELWQHDEFKSPCGSDLIGQVKLEGWQPFDDIMFWLGSLRPDELRSAQDYARRLDTNS
ncbi:MAG TPA: hypothetical protein VFH06_04855 [Candidatus Saccharimonadales bacterium]|nr:hypothetical protein [Candidatus Saccharimonadales bacterium]